MYIRSTIGLGLLAMSTEVLGQLTYLGVAIPGIDFGCGIDGSCPLNNVKVPLQSLDGSAGGPDTLGQMTHFVNNRSMNTFRLPMTWQYITGGQPSGGLDTDNFQHYDQLVQACLQTGAYCQLDLHNFARYDGGIVGQGGPTNDVFAGLWKQIATFYAKEDRIMFGLMNEPHDLDIKLWAGSCQAAVTAIREAGATSQLILLPGTNFASAETFVSTGSAEALAAITNPDGSTDNLVLDIHKYLDYNNSGSNSTCTTNNVAAFTAIGNWLRENKRMGMISETGASMDETCMTKFCEQNNYIAKNGDVFIGLVAWAAGAFNDTYLLTLTPQWTDDGWEDNKLMTECIVKPFGPAGKSVKPSSTSSSTTTTGTTTSKTSSPSSPSTTKSTANSNQTSDDESGGSRISFSSLSITAASIAALHWLVF